MSLLRSLFSSLLKDGKGPELHLGVFGKHPGWDDHLDDFGIDSEELLAVKQLLYNQGIGGAIDSGLWENMSPVEGCMDFGHWLFWRSGSTSVLGRIWSSADRKGRARYPMVACAQFNRPLTHALSLLLAPRLKAFEEACKQTEDPLAVVQLAEDCRSALRAGFASDGSAARESGPAETPHPACAMNEWMRLIFASDSQLGRFGKKVSKELSGLTARLVNGPGECETLRLPNRPLGELESILYWNRFLDHWVAPEAPCLTWTPDGAAWTDALVGRPSSKHFSYLKAPLSVLPLTSDIPFDLPEDFGARAGQRFEEIFGVSLEAVSSQISPDAAG